MSIPAEYLAACYPEPVTILGVNLRPFALGHLQLLRWLGNAYVTADRKPLSEDLAMAVFVCSIRYNEALTALYSGKIDVVTHGRWRNKTRSMPLDAAFVRWLQSLGEIDFAAKSKEFWAYLRAGTKVPTVSAKTGSDAPAGEPTPDLLDIRVTLMRHLHLTEDQVMDRPYTLCLWEVYAIGAAEGSLRFVDEAAVKAAQDAAARVKALVDSGKLKIPGVKSGV